MYDDEYKTCGATYATLRIYGIAPEEVTRDLGLSPTDSQRPGELRHGAPVRRAAWFLDSKRAVDSKDVRRLDPRPARRSTRRSPRSRRWRSERRHLSTISTAQAKHLAELELDLSFDVYFVAEET